LQSLNLRAHVHSLVVKQKYLGRFVHQLQMGRGHFRVAKPISPLRRL
jgi:hypothetical protein